MSIEQAIFTSAKTSLAAGYQLVARSPGISEDEARELSLWGPSHNSLLDREASTASVNCFRLWTGRYCISRTIAAGQEYSERGGQRIYTQCLVTDPETFARFANNPFALLRAAAAKGVVRVYDEVPANLHPFQLTGRSKVCDEAALVDLYSTLGPEKLEELLHFALKPVTLGVTGVPKVDQLFAALLNCLPVGFRAEVSLTTRLKFSPRRAYRWIALPDESAEQRQLERQHNVRLFNVATKSTQAGGSPWARCVLRALESGGAAALAMELDAHRQPMDASEVNHLGRDLLARLDSSRHLPRGAGSAGHFDGSVSTGSAKPPIQPICQQEDIPHSSRAKALVLRAHASHVAAHASRQGPSASLAALCPQATSELARLDQAVADLIAGRRSAGAEIKSLWPVIQSILGAEHAEACREQYLQYAADLWNAYVGDGQRAPEHALSALDAICLLFDE